MKEYFNDENIETHKLNKQWLFSCKHKFVKINKWRNLRNEKICEEHDQGGDTSNQTVQQMLWKTMIIDGERSTMNDEILL